MKVALLATQHPTYQPDVWRRYDALYRGGEVFRSRIAEFLPKNPNEPPNVYSSRCEEAHFTGYAGPICDWFAAKLLSASLAVKATTHDGKAVTADPFYAVWKEDVDGAGTDLVDFVRQRFTEALVKGRAWWLAEIPDDDTPDDDTPEPANRAQWEDSGRGNVMLTPLDNEQVVDFHADARGNLLWAIVYSIEMPREDPKKDRDTICERWAIYTAENVETWGVDYPAKEPRPEDAKLIGTKPNPFGRVPLIRLGFVGTRGIKVKVGGKAVNVSSGALEGFWLMRRLADPQIAHFRNSAALDWSIKRTCYAMPVFQLESDETPPTMGAGYYIKIGVNEKATWIAPPTAHLDVLAKRCETLQQEVYRVANQMAQGVNNNAAAVGRSGESKQADANSTEVVLRVYGALCREAIEATYDLVSLARGDEIVWAIDGFDVFSVADAASLVETIRAVETLAIPSTTLRKELMVRVGDALLPNAAQPTKDAIRDEIDAGVAAVVDLAEAMVPEVDEEPVSEDAEPPSQPMPAQSRQAPRKAPAVPKPIAGKRKLMGVRRKAA